MNIAFLWDWPINEFTGGVGIVTKVLAKEMQRRGWNVVFIALVSDAEKQRNAKLLKSIGLSQESYDYLAPQYFVDACQSLEHIVVEVSHILDKNNMDVIMQQDMNTLQMDVLGLLSNKYLKIINKHSQPFEAYRFTRKVFRGYVARSFSKKLWKYAVMTCPWIGRIRQKQINEPLYRKAVQSADRLCLLSSGFIGRLLHFMPDLDENKICFVNNPYTFECQMQDGNQKENLVIMVCRLVESTKNVTDFMKAWQKIENSHPDWKAEVVGDGNDMDMLKNKCRKLGLKTLTFVGYHSDVTSFYKRAKIVCVTSWYEGWPMILLEGMISRCVPLVYDTYEAAKDIFDDGKSGFLIKSCKPQELANKMENLMEHPKMLEEIGKAASKKVMDFSPEEIVDKWEELFMKIKEEKHV